MSFEPSDELLALSQALSRELARRQRHGQRHVAALELPEAAPRPTPRAPAPTTAPPAAVASAAPAPSPRPARTAPPAIPKPIHRRTSQAGPGDMATLRQTVAHCMDCGLSAGPRGSGALIGRGSAQPQLVFVTDFAGPAERSYGKVLGPEAGQMIANMVTQGFFLALDQVYLTAAVKCPLAQGCRPSPKESKACSRHLEAELRLLRPRAIVAFGALAATALGAVDPGGIEPMRGRLLNYSNAGQETPLVITAHPRDMLADPSLKGAAWRDLQLLIPHLVRPDGR